MASAGTERDLRLRPRLLLALLNDCLPLPDYMAPPPDPADLAYAVDAVHAHGLLAEHAADGDPGLRDEWRAAVDAWVDRLLGLMDSKWEHNRWVGTSFLGLTFQECSDGRFVESYSDWFQKVLRNMKIAYCKMGCTTQHLLAILSKFPSLTFSKLRNEATSLAKKVIKPLLRLLDDNGHVTEKAADLLGLLMKLFPSSVYRHFNEVESVITAELMSSQYNLQQLKKLASTLALLPCVRTSQNNISLMIQKILLVVNNMLNDNFLGLIEGHSDEELLMLLVPPGTKLVPPVRGQTRYSDGDILLTMKSRAHVVLAISGLIHCCSVMLTSSYPIQVTNIPVRALVTLIQKVLLVDGSLHQSLFQSNTSFYEELICSDIPTLHSTFLDLISSTIKGMHSSLIPHAGIVVSLITEYFKGAKLPSIRRKLYTVVRLLLSSIGVGMVMQLLQVVISNIFADLDDNSRSSLFPARTDPVQAATWSPLEGSSNMEQRHQLQSSTVLSSEYTCTRQIMAPLCVKIGALETLEVLFNVGGSFRSYSWRTEMDLLLIVVARDAYYKAGMYKQKLSCNEDPSISDFLLASFKTLLASFLANPHERPPYLEQGLKLFNRGKLEAGTELGKYCSHVLLILDVLLHPEQLPSCRGAQTDLGLRSVGTEQSVLGSGIPHHPCVVRKRRATNDLGGECKYQLVSSAEEPTDALAKHIAVEKHAPVLLSRMQKGGRGPHNINGEHPEMDACCLPTEGTQAAPAPVLGSSRTDVKMVDGSCCNPAAFDTLGDPPDSFNGYYPAPMSTTTPYSRNHGDEISSKKSGNHSDVMSSDYGSISQSVVVHTFPGFVAASGSGSEWNLLDALVDLDGVNGEHPEMDACCLPNEGTQAAPAPVLGSSRTDVQMMDGSFHNPAAFDTLGGPPDSFNVYYPAPMSTTTPDSRDHGDEISNKKSGNHGDILSSNYGSSSQSVVAHTSPGFTVPAASGSGSEWDPFDALVDLDDVDVDSGHGW